MRSRILMTREDRQHERQHDIEREHRDACDCGEGRVEAQWRVSRYWRGWLVWCRGCGALLAEVDDE